MRGCTVPWLDTVRSTLSNATVCTRTAGGVTTGVRVSTGGRFAHMTKAAARATPSTTTGSRALSIRVSMGDIDVFLWNDVRVARQSPVPGMAGASSNPPPSARYRSTRFSRRCRRAAMRSPSACSASRCDSSTVM